MTKILGPWAPHLQSLLRVAAALLLLQYGTAKILGFPHNPYFDHLQPFSLIWFAGLIELVAGILLVLGLFTRPAAFIVSGEMAFAYFIAHAPHNFFPQLNGGDHAVEACFVFLFLAAAGPGPISLDRRLKLA